MLNAVIVDQITGNILMSSRATNIAIFNFIEEGQEDDTVKGKEAYKDKENDGRAQIKTREQGQNF